MKLEKLEHPVVNRVVITSSSLPTGGQLSGVQLADL